MNGTEQIKPETGKRSVFGFGEFTLDLESESLLREGEKVSLNHRMYQVLRLLIERQGEVVTKDEFFKEVWGGSFVEDNNLTVTIRALRKVLGDDAKHARFIENIPRKGYRFIAEVTTPSGSAKAAQPAAEAPLSRNSRRWLPAVAVAASLIVVLAVVGFGFKAFWPSNIPATKPIDSIAILPFADRTGESAYLSDGLTDGVISDLSRLSRLRVIDRNSAYEFKDRPSDPLSAARELNVRAVVTGQIEQQGDQLVITAELVDSETNSQIWRQQFRRSSTEIFSVQQEIAEAIMNAVTNGAEGNRARASKRPTQNPEAYDLYLKGRYYWNKRSQADFLRAIDFFKQAIDKDPTFAKAYVGLADSYTLGGLDHLGIGRAERIGLARGAVKKALEIDNTLGEAYAASAINKVYYDWDFAGAEADYRRAIELSPSDATAHHWFAEYLAMQGRFDESLAEYDKAMAVDPLSLPIRTDRAYTYYYARNFDKAIELLNAAKAVDPDYERTYDFLDFTFREKGMFREATEAARQNHDLKLKKGSITPEEHSKAKQLVDSLRKGLEAKGVPGYWRAYIESDFGSIASPFFMAVAHAKLGEKDKAFEYLEKAYKEHYSGMVWLKVTPELEALRNDPRYGDMLRRVGFVN